MILLAGREAVSIDYTGIIDEPVTNVYAWVRYLHRIAIHRESRWAINTPLYKVP